MTVMGRGSVIINVQGATQLITQVYYILELKNNLLSIGQLQEKGLAIFKHDNICKLFHFSKGLIIQSEMTTNSMFVILASMNSTKHEHARFQAVTGNQTKLWHCQLGHLNYKGLRILH